MTTVSRVLLAGLAAWGIQASASTAMADDDGDRTADDGLLVTGYLDTAWSHLAGDGRFVGGAPDRVFDTGHDDFAVHQAAATVAYQPKEGWGGVVNPTLGDDANVIRAYNGSVSAAKADLTQAFVQYASHGFALMGGKFATLAGTEVIPPTADTNVSRSILFGFAVPFTHTGLRGVYAPSDALSVYLGVNNGWDAVKDVNSGKTVEIGASVTPSKRFNIAAYGYFGRERVDGLVAYGPEGQRSLVDFQATWNVDESVSFVVNADWGRQANAGSLIGSTSNATWSGVASYVNYTYTEHWKSSLRVEFLDDSAGYRTGVVQTWHETTATLAYLPVKQVELRAELRLDGSNVRSFQTEGGDLMSTQGSEAIEAIVKY